MDCHTKGTVTAVTVRVYNDVMPLRRVPADGVYGSQSFDTFVDAVMNPLFAPEPVVVPVTVSDASLDVVAEGVTEASVESTVESTNDSHSSGEHQRSVVERLKKKKVKNGVTQYLVRGQGQWSKLWGANEPGSLPASTHPPSRY